MFVYVLLCVPVRSVSEFVCVCLCLFAFVCVCVLNACVQCVYSMFNVCVYNVCLRISVSLCLFSNGFCSSSVHNPGTPLTHLNRSHAVLQVLIEDLESRCIALLQYNNGRQV